MRLLLTLFIASLFPASAAYAQQDSSSRYANCTALTRQDAPNALKQATLWHQQTGTVAALHCRALALFELQDYAAAANELDTILRSVRPEQGKLWLSMKLQAAKAHLYANAHQTAETHLTDALNWASDQDGMEDQMVPILMQRGEVYALSGENLKAINDLDHAYALRPGTNVQLERAKIFIRMNKNQSAADDLQAILKLEPNHAEAKQLLRSLN